jgi:formylglycine-generating enzyme required for sulfatase activity
MRKSILYCNAALVLLALVAADARAVTMSWSLVGNPGNAADTRRMGDGTTGYGAVGYSYNIGTYDVTNSQYVEFLNAKDPTGVNHFGLYNSNMSNSAFPFFGGINFNSGSLPGSKYSVISGDGNHPVNFVNWFDAVRFANWLNNGQGNGDTESGAYTLLGNSRIPTNEDSIRRNAGATVFVPSENEWYKAAYYDSNTNSYFNYTTSSNTTPTGSGPTALPNHANIIPGGPDAPTDVGAYSGTTSPYGAFDMGGNVWQWNETWISTFLAGTYRGLRGGGYLNNSAGPLFSSRNIDDPFNSDNAVGFRVASTVPEPSSLVLAALGFIGLAAWRLRRR